jgi:hypothetical protein
MTIRFLLHCIRNSSHQTTTFFTHECLRLHGSGLADILETKNPIMLLIGFLEIWRPHVDSNPGLESR